MSTKNIHLILLIIFEKDWADVCYSYFMDEEAEALGDSTLVQGHIAAKRPKLKSSRCQPELFFSYSGSSCPVGLP